MNPGIPDGEKIITTSIIKIKTKAKNIIFALSITFINLKSI